MLLWSQHDITNWFVKPLVEHFVRLHLGFLKPEATIYGGAGGVEPDGELGDTAFPYTYAMHPLHSTSCQSHGIFAQIDTVL